VPGIAPATERPTAGSPLSLAGSACETRVSVQSVPQKLPRFHLRQQKADDERKVAAILLESGETAPDARTL
jgi:hypothetical protein